MNVGAIRRLARTAALGAALLTVPVPALAQLNGENLLGDMGIKSGTQPEPGFYASFLYYRYNTDTIKDPSGNRIRLDPTGNGSQTINAGVPIFYYVSKARVLGGHFGAMAVVPLANGSLEAPGFGLSEDVSTGFSDLYVMPAQLGWHFKRADATVGVAFFAPTGRYTTGADDNLGKGMWSFELSGGGTTYLDEGRSISLSTTAYWETHSKKDGAVFLPIPILPPRDVKVGQLLTLEGGAGKSFLHGALQFGLAYYAQWKVTADDLGFNLPPNLDNLSKHRVFGIGPEATLPIAVKKKLIALINVRYLIEQGAQFKTQGNTLIITSTFPFGIDRQ